MKPKGKTFRASALRLVAKAYPWPDPPAIGARVTLNSGGPDMLVVDTYGDACVTAQSDGSEHCFPWRCLRPL